jgi:6-phosphogluconolactonase (cycloisomerase 2 family)
MFNKKSIFRFYLISVAIASFTVALLTFHPVQARINKPTLSGIVYTQSNIPTENGNSILGFRRDDDGKLTPLPNSPFPTGGQGIVDPQFNLASIDGDRQLITNPERTRLFAVNSGSNTIAVFDIFPDGKLSPVKGSPFPSGGVYPVSLSLVDDFLYVANKNLDPQDLSRDASGSLPNYTSFRVTQRGRLIPRFTFEVPVGSAPEAIVISPDEKFLFSVEQFGQMVRAFRILRNGRLSESINSPLSGFSSIANTTPVGPVGIEVHPKLPFVYIGYPLSSKVGVYSYNDYTGELTFLKVVSNSGQAICWLYANEAGTRLYTAESFSNSVSVYDLAEPSNPVEIQHLILQGSNLPLVNGLTQVGPVNIALDPTESFLNVISQRQQAIAPLNEGTGVNIFRVNSEDGTLSEVSSSPFVISPVSDSRPQGVVAF